MVMTLSNYGTNPNGTQWKLFRVFNAEAINGTGSATSDGENISPYRYYGLWAKSTSATGTSNVKIEMEQSWDDTAGNYVEPQGYGDIITTMNDDNPHVFTLAPYPMPFLRIKVTGNTGNPADTVITVYLFVEE